MKRRERNFARFKSAVVAAALLLPAIARGQAQPVAATPLNSSGDDYAAAFRSEIAGAPASELWLTTSSGAPNTRSRRIVVSSIAGGNFDRPTAIASPEINHSAGTGPGATNQVMLDGSPAFPLCGGNGIIVSNRVVAGRATGNDLYEIRMLGGEWRTVRLENLSSPHWDDTPALAPNGQIVFFSSDRAEPGSRRPDIYYARRSGLGWSEPKLLASVSDNAAEECPFVGADGWFYYVSNRRGTYDIWRAKLDPKTGLPADRGRLVELAGVNTDSTDETHPLLSPGGNWFLFSSNRGPKGTKDFDLYWTSVERPPITLDLTVLKRVDTATIPIRSRVDVRERYSGARSTIESDLRGHALLTIPRAPGSSPAGDLPADHEIILQAERPSAEFVPSIDTLAFSAGCADRLEHTLFLWDTSAYFRPGCTEKFPINKVRFFITGYWCPTTQKYRQYAPCNSLFIEDACTTVACTGNDLYKFSVSVQKQHPECIRFEEFERHGTEFAREVDSTIESLVANIGSTFDRECMKRAISRGDTVHVEVRGFTDPRAYQADCRYSGGTIDFTNSVVQVAEEKKKWFVAGTRMKSLDPTGNQLLSDLRAYFMASLLDGVWNEKVPEYRDLRAQGKIRVMAIGDYISKENTSYERQRSVEVRVTIPSMEGRHEAGLKAMPGKRIVFCDVCEVRTGA